MSTMRVLISKVTRISPIFSRTLVTKNFFQYDRYINDKEVSRKTVKDCKSKRLRLENIYKENGVKYLGAWDVRALLSLAETEDHLSLVTDIYEEMARYHFMRYVKDFFN